jgi:hypothetical protein
VRITIDQRLALWAGRAWPVVWIALLFTPKLADLGFETESTWLALAILTAVAAAVALVLANLVLVVVTALAAPARRDPSAPTATPPALPHHVHRA